MHRDPVPPWVAALLRFLAADDSADDVIGDLAEMRDRRLERHGRLVAGVMMRFGALDMAVALLRQRWRARHADAHRFRSGVGPGSGTPDRERWDPMRALERWQRDFVLAARSLGRAPGFAAMTVTTLAVAIGSNTAIFSVIDTVLLDPLDFPASDRLVWIAASAPGSDLPEEFGPAPEFYVQYGEEADLLEDLGLFRTGQTTVRSDEQIDRLFVTQATPSLFTTLGAVPALGRLPTLEDDPGQVMVISHWLWTTWFDSDPAVVGRSYEVSGNRPTVIGVLRADFRFPDDRTALWVHQRLSEDEADIQPGSFGFNLVGRVRPGTELAALESQLAVLASRLPDRFGGPPQYARIIEQHRPVVRTLEAELVGDVAGPLWLLLGTVGIILLIACANVANLFTVRGEGRRRDLAVRQALGAGRFGLVRAQMAEALLLSAAGGIGGILLAWIGLPLLVRVAPENIPNLSRAHLDGAAFGFTAGVAILTALVFGLIPAWRFSRPRSVGALRQSGHIGEDGRRVGRDALVLVQTSLALVLLVGSGLLMRSFWTLSNVDPGYDTENIFTFQVAPQREGVDDGPSFARFHAGFMEQVAAIPGVESVGLTNWLPLDEGAATNRFYTEQSIASGETPPPLRFTFAGGEYFRTMGIAIERGRAFEDDLEPGPTEVVVSQEAASRLWPGEDPLGKRLLMSQDTSMWMTVVGVAEDILVDDLRQAEPDPMLYLPTVGPRADLWGVGSPAYVVRSSRADVLAPEIRALMREHVPESPMYRVFTMEGLHQRTMAQLSFTMLMLAIGSGMALILGAVGLYGVLSYVVTNRSREIAVRMALGAEAERVRRMVVMQGARVTIAGVAIGLIIALFVTRLLESLLFGVGALDLVTFTAMSLVILAVAFLASYIPARRASLVDPMRSLRAE